MISNMIGTGIFTTSGFLAGQLGSAKLVLLIWGVGAVCALAGAFCYSELGINFPSSGGEYVYLTRSLRPYLGIHDRLGFVFRRFLRAHCRRGAGILRLSRTFLAGLRLESARMSSVRAPGVEVRRSRRFWPARSSRCSPSSIAWGFAARRECKTC